MSIFEEYGAFNNTYTRIFKCICTVKLIHLSYLLTKHQMACAPIEDSDQPGHPPSLVSVFAVLSMDQWVPQNPSFLHADRED